MLVIADGIHNPAHGVIPLLRQLGGPSLVQIEFGGVVSVHADGTVVFPCLGFGAGVLGIEAGEIDPEAAASDLIDGISPIGISVMVEWGTDGEVASMLFWPWHRAGIDSA